MSILLKIWMNLQFQLGFVGNRGVNYIQHILQYTELQDSYFFLVFWECVVTNFNAWVFLIRSFTFTLQKWVLSTLQEGNHHLRYDVWLCLKGSYDQQEKKWVSPFLSVLGPLHLFSPNTLGSLRAEAALWPLHWHGPLSWLHIPA